jgi:predicted protein tyrosine phosphatase
VRVRHHVQGRAFRGEGAAGAVHLRGQPDRRAIVHATPGIRTRSAGLSDLARVQVTDELLAWADLAFLMEPRLLALLRKRFELALVGKAPVCLDVPDDFQFGQPELVAVLTEQLAPHLGQPAASR